jgi:hypothetical protein
MGRIREGLRKLTKSPGVPQARHIAERSVAPYLRADVHQLALDHASAMERLTSLELKADGLLQGLDAHMPAVLNAIASSNGTARLLARETQGLRQRIDDVGQRIHDVGQRIDDVGQRIHDVGQRIDDVGQAIWAGDEAVREELRPHIQTLAWLLQRVETVRAEMMHELRYGQSHEAAKIEPKVINAEHLNDDDIRLNLGAGHIAIEGFVNVDMRELPGIDVVAPIDDLPFEPGTIAEIFSSHTIEHFPEQDLRRRLLPYWVGLLKPAGTFRAIVPDLEAMTKAYVNGEMTFEILRAVTYGGQEYEGDFHFTGFTPDSMSSLLVECGLERPKVTASGRPNGDCLEFEISATKPSG